METNLFDSYKIGAYTVNIYYDTDPENPRTWPCSGTIYSNMRDMSPDGHKINELFDESGELNKEYLDKNYFWLPIYAYIHSGITIRARKSFEDKWDSGLFGIIAITHKRAIEEYNFTKVTSLLKQIVMETLNYEVQELDNYYTGDVYRYVILDKKGSWIGGGSGYYGMKGLEAIKNDAQYMISLQAERLSDPKKAISQDTKEEFVLVPWPKSQKLVDLEGFDENAYLINDERGLEEFGGGAYFVRKSWLEKLQ